MNFKGIIFACDDAELLVILDAIMIRNKKLLSGFVQDHQELLEPIAKAPEVPPEPEMTDEAKNDLDEIVYNVIKTLAEEKIGTGIEDVIKEVIVLDYSRDIILESMDRLLDKGVIYEPEASRINYVNV